MRVKSFAFAKVHGPQLSQHYKFCGQLSDQVNHSGQQSLVLDRSLEGLRQSGTQLDDQHQVMSHIKTLKLESVSRKFSLLALGTLCIGHHSEEPVHRVSWGAASIRSTCVLWCVSVIRVCGSLIRSDHINNGHETKTLVPDAAV